MVDYNANEDIYTFKVQFVKIDTVKRFVAESEDCQSNITVISHNNYVVDGKSLMGLFGLDLSEPVEITTTNVNDYNELWKYCKSEGILVT